MAQLKKEKIATDLVQRDATERTAYSVILVAGSGHRAILTARGASRFITAEDVAWEKIQTRWFYLTSVAGNTQLMDRMFKEAKRLRAHVAWNPGGAEIKLGLKALLPHLMQTDILVLNREEASVLAQAPYRELGAILRTLGHLPRQALVITEGEKGAYAMAHGSVWHATPPKTKAINTTGAGDAFGSAFTAAAMQDPDLTWALRAGAVNSAGVVAHMGSKVGIFRKFPSANELSKVAVKEAQL